MKIWKDSQGHEYKTQITVAEVRELKNTLGINLMEFATGELMQKLSEDVCLLCDVLYVIHHEQARNYGITDADFGRNLYGDALEAATQAFVEEAINFFPNEKTRNLLNKAMTLGQERMDKAMEKAEKELEKELRKPIE